MKWRTLFVVLCLAATLAAQSSSGGSTKKSSKAKKASSDAVTQSDLQALKDALAAQQQQIQQLTDQLKQRDAQIQQAQSAASEAQSKAESAADAAKPVASLQTDVADLKANSTSTAQTLQETQKRITEGESPLTVRYKGIGITPVGFIAAETVTRSRALASDVNTPFNTIFPPGATQNRMWETFGSGRQSRLGLLAEGKVSSFKLSGYWEADFLSAGVTSNNNQSNSYTFRQRQLWGQAALDSGWSFTGGQMWSLVTETKKGMDNRSEALPMTIDAQYTIGFSWARQYGFRITKNFGNEFWLGFAIEDPQATLTAHGNTANFVLGSLGTAGGLYNAFNGNYAFNPTPDYVFKAAFEPGKGKYGHYEIIGLIADFRDRIFPCATTAAKVTCSGVVGPSAAGAFNNSVTGTGVGANARVSLLQKHMDVGFHFLAGDGIGRYGTGGLPDLTVNTLGELQAMRSYQGLGTIEFHYPRFDFYLNGGVEYVDRDAFVNSAKAGVGYGSPLFKNTGCSTEPIPAGSNGFTPGSLANCTADTKNLNEFTVGFWYRIYNGPKGRLQFGPQYSYVERETWQGVGVKAPNGTILGTTPKGIDNMIFTSFRYYLP